MRDLSRIMDGPRDIESSDRLVHGALILSGLALADLVHPRFRWLAYGAASWLAASAFTGRTPASAALRRAGMKSRHELEHERHGLSREESDACDANELYVGDARESHTEHRGFGVPHRIPHEGVLVTAMEPRSQSWDPDDRPAPSPDGDLGLAD